MRLINKTSTITVAVVAALVALAIAAHAGGALSLAPSHPAGHTGAGPRRTAGRLRGVPPPTGTGFPRTR
jgi:hypothetical protein